MPQRVCHRHLGLLALVVLAHTAGCMSWMSHVGGPSGLEGPFPPYAATKLDLELATAPLWVEEGEPRFDAGIGLCMLLGAVDFPLTALVDTAFLPLDVARTMKADKAGSTLEKLTLDE